ncbi:hypothetical protein GsuE55_27820 [Geobacillus subterraneus]|uniref:Pre-toxin TG domain-containing protein n=1 Tax=Geobacillus subterraneus TaxID=129338 RepID=A0A679FS88_9BACL|nr:hypothetical protein GsuE55_27820 [Geobacillus subterraneus]
MGIKGSSAGDDSAEACELETVAKHIPDAEDACQRARTTLSWEPSSLAMDLLGVSTPAIEALRDELIHWLRRYEEKLNEAEELLYRTAAAMRQADETLADNMKEVGFELLGWYDVQRVFGEYDPITGERLLIGDRLLAGGMLLLSIVPPAKSASVAGKAAVKGAKAIDAASALAKVKHVARDDKMKAIGDIAFRQTIRAPLAETARLFKKQWDEVVESVASFSWQPAYAGVGPAPRVWMGEAKDATLNRIKNVEGEAVEKGISEAEKLAKGTKKTRPSWRQSEIDVGKEYPGYREQVSFKDGNEVSHGTKNSSRPDFYINGHSVEVKNYKVTTFSGRSNLIRSVSKQINKRISDLIYLNKLGKLLLLM